MSSTLLLLCLSVFGSTLFGQTSPEEWKARLVNKAGAIGITAADAQECTISSSYTDASSGIEYAYVQQTYQQLRVFNNIITLAYKGGRLVHSSGRFVNNIRELNLAPAPTLEANAALVTSARHLRLKTPPVVQTKQNRFATDRKIIFAPAGIADRDIETELLWAQDDAGGVHLAWNVNIDVAGSDDWWNVRVDARSGEVISKDNWTVHEATTEQACQEQRSGIEEQVMRANPFAGKSFNQSLRNSTSLWAPPNVQNASYLVVPFPYESRNFGPVAVDNNPWLKAGAGNAATTYGWHFDGTTNYLSTRGNNVFAYDDTASRNTPGISAVSTTPVPDVSFGYQPDFSKQPVDSVNQRFNITNLFYWNNVVHDVTYQYGFDENAGNFQTNNLGRGGTGGDHVLAEAQDGSGYSNADFSTPADGFSGRMQMYLFTGADQPVAVNSPASIAGKYTARESNVSLRNKLWKQGQLTGEVAIYTDTVSGTQYGCDSSKLPLNSVAGKIALMDRGGSCPFTVKFRSAQKAGAIGLIVVNNVPGDPPAWGATTLDNGIVIPGIMVTQPDGAKIVEQVPLGVVVTMNAGILQDGDLDNGIITHEYGHGVSNRLTGGRLNASCLNNAEQGGEGWSDYLALMITTDWSTAQLTDGDRARPMGTYALGQPATSGGIRRYPYSTYMGYNPLTYAYLAGSTEVHDIGEVWCSALWDMTWNIIQHEGKITPGIYNSTGGGGNTIALKLVIEGMKLQPCRPGFLDARNAILAADSILYNNRHKCDIWKAFARRGMGVSAKQGLATVANDQTAAFDVPTGILLTKSAVPGSVSVNQQVTTTLTLTCQCAPVNGFTVTETIATGFGYVSSTQGSFADNVVKFSPISFSNPLESQTLGITLVATGTPCGMVKAVNDNRDTDSTGGFTAARITGGSNWVSSTTHFNSGSRAWYAPNANGNGTAGTTNFTLTSAPFAVSSLSVLSFWHYFVTENGFDGGKVEISADNGGSWTDARPYFLQNGYNTQLTATALEPNTFAFSGTSYATGSNNNGQFLQSQVNLSAFSGQTVLVRFRFLTTSSGANTQLYDGWYIDDIAVTNGCGGISKVTVGSSSGQADSLNLPVYITPVQAPLPLTLVSFLARQTGSEVALQWQTHAELNVQDYAIERSSDGRNWSVLGSVGATGNSSAFYNYTDLHPLQGKHNYYRIRMTDKDGQYTYTVIRVITLAESGIASISPNPARNWTQVYFAGKTTGAELLLTDLTGRVLQRHIIAGNAALYRLQTTGLPAGTYLVKMQLGTSMVTKKLVVGQ